MKCPNCGKENPEGFIYCGFCGRRLKEDKLPPPENHLENRSRRVLTKALDKKDKEMLDFMLYNPNLTVNAPILPFLGKGCCIDAGFR